MMYRVFAQGMLQTNCIVLQRDGNCVVVDCAYGSSDVESYIARNSLNLVAVLLTHGHFDHCGGVQHLLQSCGNGKDIPVFVGQKDLLLAQNASKNRWHIPARACFPTQTLSEGRFSVDNFSFDVLETPGHTAGSVCYVCEDLLLCGDTLFRNSVGRTDFPESQPLQLKQSLQKLCSLQKNYTLLCGHGQMSTLDSEKKNNPYLYDITH